MSHRVLLVEPWFGGSHRQWAEGWAAHSRHHIDIVAHEAQFWRWRLRGGSATLAELVRTRIAADGPPDLLVVSEMVDIAALVGLCRRELADVPVVAYFHENQLTYRTDPGTTPEDGPVITNWLSALAADEVWFNSDFHRRSFFDHLPAFLEAKPDYQHHAMVPAVEARSSVVPVGLDLTTLAELGQQRTSTRGGAGGAAPRIVWNQRWDHDKNPGRFFGVLTRLAHAGVDFTVALAGENRRSDPREFTAFTRDFGDRIDHIGHLNQTEYQQLLATSDVVVSTALQEFFGISMIEAVVAGAVPLLPKRLAYPEIIPEQYHHAVLYHDDQLPAALTRVLSDLDQARAETAGLAKDCSRFAWPRVVDTYDDAVNRVVKENRP